MTLHLLMKKNQVYYAYLHLHKHDLWIGTFAKKIVFAEKNDEKRAVLVFCVQCLSKLST